MAIDDGERCDPCTILSAVHHLSLIFPDLIWSGAAPGPVLIGLLVVKTYAGIREISIGRLRGCKNVYGMETLWWLLGQLTLLKSDY